MERFGRGKSQKSVQMSFSSGMPQCRYKSCRREEGSGGLEGGTFGGGTEEEPEARDRGGGGKGGGVDDSDGVGGASRDWGPREVGVRGVMLDIERLVVDPS